MLKVCKYCGKPFVPSAHFRSYCSDECAELGKRQNRLQWIEKTEYRKHDAEKHRQKRDQQRQYNDEISKEREKALEIEQEKRLKEIAASFNAKCEAGDPFSLMLKAKEESGNTSIEYWNAFQQYILSLGDSGDAVLVNGLSVYDDDFSERVSESIRELKSVKIYKVKV